MDRTIINHLEIWPEDLGKLTWSEAETKLAELGPDWRLPTLGELKHTLLPNRDRIFGDDTQLHGRWYLSSTPGGADNNHWVVDFGDGYSNYFHDENDFYILPVRDFTGEIALDYLLKEF